MNFEDLFYVAFHTARCQGRVPVAALFGPEEMTEFRSQPKHHCMMTSEAWLKGDYRYNDLPVKRMQSPGVAVVTRRPGHFVKFQVAGKG